MAFEFNKSVRELYTVQGKLHYCDWIILCTQLISCCSWGAPAQTAAAVLFSRMGNMIVHHRFCELHMTCTAWRTLCRLFPQAFKWKCEMLNWMDAGKSLTTLLHLNVWRGNMLILFCIRVFVCCACFSAWCLAIDRYRISRRAKKTARMSWVFFKIFI